MSEIPGPVALKDAFQINPNLIGGAENSKRRLRIPGTSPNLTETELTELREIDSRGISLDDIQEWADNHVVYFESKGAVKLGPYQEKEFEEAKKLRNWLVRKEYSRAAALFLKKAKKEWREDSGGMDNDRDEYTWRILGAEDVGTVPRSVAAKGDSAIKQFFVDNKKGLILRVAYETPATYLRQAAVLARLIRP